MQDEMEYTEEQGPAAQRPVELANPRVPRGERSHQGADTATSGDSDEAQSDPTRHHPGARLGRDERSARRRCQGAHRRPTDRLIAVSEGVKERVNGCPARLDEAAKAVHVAQRCGTDRGPACHVPLPARQGYRMNITVNYDRRQIAKPWVASVDALMILPPRCSRQGARTILGVLYEVGQSIPRDVVQGHEYHADNRSTGWRDSKGTDET